MKVVDLAGNIWFSDLNEVADTSVPKIIAWLLAHTGDLNDLLATSYVVVGQDLSPELGVDEAAIFTALYLMNYYQRQIQSNLGASGMQIVEVREADSVVRLVNKNEIARTYLQLKNQLRDQLNEMARLYRKWKCIPASYSSPFSCGIIKKTD